MKRAFICVLLAAVMAMVCGCSKKAAVQSSRAAKEEIRESIADRIVGTWVLVQSTHVSTPSGIGCRLKSYTGTHWIVTQPDPNTGRVVFHHGGRYTLEGDMLSATTDFANTTTQSAIGKSEKLKITIDGDILKQIDIDRGIYNETWERCKPRNLLRNRTESNRIH
ncbi:MAG: hypothetical protein JXA73_00475 [Acidobacteria bacterium]|nr:hypothetical protein [Acidobacteriota bacterium]